MWAEWDACSPSRCRCREFTWTSRWGSTPTTTPRSPPKTNWRSCSCGCDSCSTRWSRSRRSRTTRGWRSSLSADLWPVLQPPTHPSSPCVCVPASIARSVFGWPARAPTSECCGGPSHRRSSSSWRESGRWNISRASSRPRNWCSLSRSTTGSHSEFTQEYINRRWFEHWWKSHISGHFGASSNCFYSLFVKIKTS